jgi:hypothetical protein
MREENCRTVYLMDIDAENKSNIFENGTQNI